MGDRTNGVLASVSVHRLVEICNSQGQICDLHFEISSTCQIVEMPATSALRFLYAAELNLREHPRIESVGGFWPNPRERSDSVELAIGD